MVSARTSVIAPLIAIASAAACGGTDSGGVPGTTDASAAVADAEIECEPETCADLGWECGQIVTCGEIHDCADEGLSCGEDMLCVGGVDEPAACTTGLDCPLCSAIPDCTGEPQTTILTGRVITPGRSDGNTGNQVGVPNALVYILNVNDVGALPELPVGLPPGESRCDRCDDQQEQLGPVLNGAVTDATGRFTIEESIPVGVDFLLVVKAGKFRRATTVNIPADGACETTQLPEAMPQNPTRLPRDISDGLGVNLPKVAVTTGRIDAMECVFEKIGLDHDEFGNHGGNAHFELYRGASVDSPSGAKIDDSTPHNLDLYSDISRLEEYDLVVADCEGLNWDYSRTESTAHGEWIREYLNRGGRLFASHLSFTWLYGNGTTSYDPLTATETGLDPAATWQTTANGTISLGNAIVAIGRPNASPRIDQFADWLESEGVTAGPAYEFAITDPRSQVTGLGASSQEYVHCDGDDCQGDLARTQQFSFDTPYGAPATDSCGRVAYSGFHVASGNFYNSTFPAGCDGDLTDQEKVLLYMLFDLSTCVGDPLPPSCVPVACGPKSCGPSPNGCGGIRDCGPCGPLVD